MRDDQQQDLKALVPGRSSEEGPTRRLALQTALGLGYAAAATPLMAQTAISTPADGLTAGEVHFTVNGFKVPAYRAAPAGKKNVPVVLVISEIFGVHEYIADTCRRLARAGYLAIAPDLYARQGDPKTYTDIAKLMSELVSRCPTSRSWPTWTAPCNGPAPRAAIRRAWPSRAFAGAGASPGCMRPMARSRPAWPGTAGWRAPRRRCSHAIRWSWSPASRRRCWACMAGRTRAFRWNPWSACARRSSRARQRPRPRSS